MRIKYLAFLSLIVILFGCEKEETLTGPVNPPKSISVISGNNQVGYPNEYLNDSIVVEITPENINDLSKYSYSFKGSDYYSGVYASDTILGNKMYVYVKWKLNSSDKPQELKFFLNEKCDSYDCSPVDSVLISASIKPRWKKTLSGSGYGTFYDIHFSDDNNGILVGDLPYGTGYYKTTDGGKTWNTVSNSRSDLYQLSFADNYTGIVVVTNNWAYFTNDGGASFYQGNWTPPITGHRSSSDYFMFNSKEMFTVGGNATIAKSTDGGKSWSTYKGFTFKNYLYDITCVDKSTCYACGSIGKIVKTTDGGETWHEQEILLNNYLKKIYFLDKDYGFSVGQYGALVRTEDGGENWEIIKTGLRFTIIEIKFYSRDLGYIVSSSGEIGKTTDGGLTWELVNKDNYGVFEINKAVFKDNTVLGLQGGSVFQYDLISK